MNSAINAPITLKTRAGTPTTSDNAPRLKKRIASNTIFILKGATRSVYLRQEESTRIV
jgi:hypothetical protein